MTEDKNTMLHLPRTDGFRWVHFILTTILLPILWVFHSDIAAVRDKVQSNAESIALMSSNRFTSQDGLDVWKEIGHIREDIAMLPPEDFKIRMTKLEDQISETNQRLARLETHLIRMNGS